MLWLATQIDLIEFNIKSESYLLLSLYCDDFMDQFDRLGMGVRLATMQ